MLFQKNESFNILSCSVCRAGGAVGRRSCSECRGMAMGRLARGGWLYFGQSLTRYQIALRRGRRWLTRFEALGALVFGLGFLGLALWRLYRLSEFDLIFTSRFWLEASLRSNAAPFFFWLAAIAFSFLGYRLAASNKKLGRVEARDYRPLAAAPEEDKAGALDWSLVRQWPRKKRRDAAAAFTAEAKQALEETYRLADRHQHESASAAHVFYVLLSCPKIRGVFIRLGIPVDGLRARVAGAFQQSAVATAQVLSADVQQIIFHAYELAYEARLEVVDVTELLVATVRQSEFLQELLYDLKVDGQKLSNVVAWVRVREQLRRQRQSLQRAAAYVSKHGLDRAMTAVATPYLNHFSQDLTLAAKYGYLAPCVARDKEIEEIYRVIEGGRQSVILVGERGAGKMSVIEGIVQRLIMGDAPQRLLEKRVVQLSTSALLAGTTVSGAQERLIRIMNEVRRSGNIVLFINNIHDLVSLSGEQGGEGLDVSETLAEYLGRGGVVAFATTTPEGFKRHVINSQLGSVLARVEVDEMDENQAIQVLESKAGGVEYKHNVFFSYDAIEQSVKLGRRFLHDQTLPASALEVMSEAGSYARSRRGEHIIVKAEDVASVITDKTGVPATTISEDESAKLIHLEEEMHKRVIGQDQAVGLVANALRRARVEIRSTKKPIATFLFLGPTGVGKTELAKTIAEVYFGGEARMIRVDMSEYQDKSAVYRLIGQPGQKGTGILTEAVREQPFSMVLLDEMEKADPDVLNLFLQVFDDGRLTDSVGRVIDFTSAIIIATSNAGTDYVQEQMRHGVLLEDIRQQLIRGELKKYYRPEFLNRFDGIVLFRALAREEIKKVASLMLKRVATDLEKRGVGMKVEEAALEALAEAGFDPEFGARPMRRAIQEQVENKLAELVLAKRLKRRDTVVLGEGAEVRVESAS